MGVEVEESNLPVVSGEAEVTVVDESSLLKENGKAEEVAVENNEPITFGSHGVDEPIKEEIIKPSAEVSNFPKDAVDEWPAAQQIHPFFIHKYRQFEDPKIKAKLEQADLELTKKNQARSQLIDKLRKLRGERAEKITLLKASNEENKQYRSVLDEKRKVREPLQQALGTLRVKEGDLHASEESLNSELKSKEYRIQHETISLKEEKQIMKDIKKLEATRPQVIAKAAQRAKILESMGEKTDLQEQMKLLNYDMDGVRKDQQSVLAKRKQVEDEKEAIEKQIKAVEDELNELSEKRDKTYQSILELRKQRDEGNSAYYQNRSLLNEIRGLANKKDIAAVKEKVDTEFQNWVSQYLTNKSFREDAEKRVITGLDNRQMTRDGRMRNFDEKLIFAVEKITPPETEAVSKTLPKHAPPPKEEVAAPAPAAVVEKEKSGKAQKESKKANKANAAAKAVDEADEPDFYVPEKKGKEAPQVHEVDEAKLKEIKREQEIAKAKQALERKKKLAEKAAAKAAIRAQKEAEKKQKALEKKEKKKAGVSVDELKETEAAAAEEVAESDKSAAEETVETTVASKNKDKKAANNTMKRRVRPRGLDSLPKPLLKRKKATNYWMWAAPAGAAMAVLLAAVVYYFLN